ncbi:TIM-barrel domain-containing protein [Winogradskyella sp. SYSU M77433]|uniref:TIM-barrel domain-containing protein n=1 Tax=Winogradskyella sp. SYSU M77433 TaxID=3042722 RepID=UPI002480097D|nr:TIM-barrel domain-containing protein [Winogradskyella sp. SYSU M77433]MDH7911923.1 glycoside hydrolase family 31 protein [Winogradskyella sp. SYSU M77433]
MKHIILYISILLVTVSITAQNTGRIFQSASFDGGQLNINVNDGYYSIIPYSSEIIETTFVPSEENIDLKSHVVISNPEKIHVEFNERTNDVLLKTSGLYVTVTKSPFQISYYYKDKFITSEKRGYYKSKHEPMDMVKGNIVADSTEKIEFNLAKDEVLYGGGARALGMNRRGYRLPLFNRAHYGYETHSELMNFTMPIVLSSNQYMIHFDNAPIGYLDLDSKGDNTLTYETVSGRKTYQIIVGESWYDMLNNYTNLTGKQPMLPRWALGNFSSRFGYHSQEEVENTISKFKEEKIPVDAIILDLYWFGKDIQGTMGNLEVFRDSFPDFEGMVKRLNDKGVKTITITEPFVLTTSKKWDEAVAKNVLAKDSVGNNARYDFYFGNTGLIDIYKPEGEQWFWNIYKDLANKGVAGVWGDLGEPEVHPDWVQHHTGSASEVHNIYGHDWARLIHEGYQRDFPNTRPFILMRAGYSGSQRYGMVPWSGDVNRTWGGLQSQPEIALQMGMQGLAYMHSDLGGFAGANLDDELYVRWLQYGVFNPIFRPHAQEDVPSEPVFRSEKAKALAKEAIELRYKLLSYNYNLMYENHTTGKPLMRPLLFEEPNNPELFNYTKTYLWGKDILVSPVLEAGKKEQEVYFPKDNIWFDFYTGERIEGGQKSKVSLKEKSIPTYVRAGAFIPTTEPLNTSKNTSDWILVNYYHDKSVLENKSTFYFDDGKTRNAFDEEEYEIMEFSSQFKGDWLHIDFKTDFGENYKTQTTRIIILVHNINSNPKRVRVNGKRRGFYFNDKNKTLTITLNRRDSKLEVTEDRKIKIKLGK